MNTFWLPQLKKYAYHKSYVDLLSKNGIGKDGHLLSSTYASPKYIQKRRDYAEGLREEPHFQVQSAHYGGGRICHIEGSRVNYKDKDGKKTSKFYSHFFDNDWKQAAYTTHQNNLFHLGHLQRSGVIKIKRTIWLSNTDGCAVQYRSGNVMYLVFILASQFQIIINRAIDPLGHGKDVVDELSEITR